MSRILFLLTFFIGCTATKTIAQNFGGGFFVGLSSSQVAGDGLAGFDKAGLIFGVQTNRKLNDKWSVQLEMMYIDKGSRTKSSDSLRLYIMQVRYIEVPLLFKYHVQKLEVLAGPSFGFLISSKETEFGIEQIPYKEFYNTETALHFGLSYPIIDKLRLDVRWSQSLLAIRDHNSGAKTFLNQGQYNTVLAFTIRYIFSNGKNE